jgi:hypothetical protein
MEVAVKFEGSGCSFIGAAREVDMRGRRAGRGGGWRGGRKGTFCPSTARRISVPAMQLRSFELLYPKPPCAFIVSTYYDRILG